MSFEEQEQKEIVAEKSLVEAPKQVSAGLSVCLSEFHINPLQVWKERN